MWQRTKATQNGFSLIELLLAIVILSIASVGMLSAIQVVTQHSPTPKRQQQAQQLAAAYLDEIMAQPLNDPNEVEQGLGSIEASETADDRSTFDDVFDYSSLSGDFSPSDYSSQTTLAAFDDFAINIQITASTLGPNAQAAWRIDVEARYPSHLTAAQAQARARLTAYRAL